MHSSGGKILVIRGGAIGDFILTLPVLSALRQQFPQVHIEVLGYPHIVQLAIAGALADRVQSIEARALAGFFARNGVLEEDLADYFSEFDIIVSYLYDPDGIFRTNVARCSRAQFIIGPHRPNETEPLHAARVFLKPLEQLAIFDADSHPRLRLAETGASEPSVLALHPGSGSERKNWPEASWAELVQHLINATRFNLLLVGGEAEGERLQRLAAALPPARVRVAMNLPLPRLALQLQGCAGFVGHDSGISHLAAALSVPALVLWGDSAEQIWRPPHDNVTILRGNPGIQSISVEQVVRAIGQLDSEATEKTG